MRDVVERVTPSILLGRRDGLTRVDEFEARHVIETGTQLRGRGRRRSPSASTRARWPSSALTYHLADGQVVLREHLGDIGE